MLAVVGSLALVFRAMVVVAGAGGSGGDGDVGVGVGAGIGDRLLLRSAARHCRRPRQGWGLGAFKAPGPGRHGLQGQRAGGVRL